MLVFASGSVVLLPAVLLRSHPAASQKEAVVCSQIIINQIMKINIRKPVAIVAAMFISSLFLAVGASQSCVAAEANLKGEKPEQTKIVGARVDDFQLLDQYGAAHRLYYMRDAAAIVIMSQGNGCPIVRNSMPEYRALRDAYAKRGIEFFLLNSNLQDNRESILGEAEEFGFDLPVLIDDAQIVGESLGVTRTAEVFVIDPSNRQVVYHGPVNDRVTYQSQRTSAENNYLADALDAVLEGKPVAHSQVHAPGCIVNFPERERKAEHAKISYSDAVAPILMERCVSCHTKGGIAPWAMDSYAMIKGFAPMIREVIRTDTMPPWDADPNIGSFKDDLNLSDDEIKTLVHWIEAGAPRGKGSDPLAEPREPVPDWPLGEPDLVLKIPAYDIPATGVVDYLYPGVDPGLLEGRWLRASTVKPGARQALHHMAVFLLDEPPGDAPAKQSFAAGAVGEYAPGSSSLIVHENSGVYMPAGSGIGFQVHYTPFGKAVRDESELGLYFYPEDEPPGKRYLNFVLMDQAIEIPPRARNHRELTYMEIPVDIVLYDVMPHAHARGKASSLSVLYPDGTEKMLLNVPRFDFDWQRTYSFSEPVEIPAGSKLISRYTYDNSARNFTNPDPEETVRWGEQTFQEMLFTNISFLLKNETDLKELFASRLSLLGFEALDDNINSEISKDELRGALGELVARHFDDADKDNNEILDKIEYGSIMGIIRPAILGIKNVDLGD